MKEWSSLPEGITHDILFMACPKEQHKVVCVCVCACACLKRNAFTAAFSSPWVPPPFSSK